ncbi:MAG: preprotein translocase subunit TatA [Halolamina sp.]
MMLQVPIPGAPELIVFLLVLLFNVGLIVLLVAAGVFLYRWWRGDGTAEQAELDALRERVAKLEARADGDSDEPNDDR